MVGFILGVVSLAFGIVAAIVLYRERVLGVIEDFDDVAGLPVMLLAVIAGGSCLWPAISARREINNGGGLVRGKGLAISGLVSGLIGMTIALAVVFVVCGGAIGSVRNAAKKYSRHEIGREIRESRAQS